VPKPLQVARLTCAADVTLRKNGSATRGHAERDVSANSKVTRVKAMEVRENETVVWEAEFEVRLYNRMLPLCSHGMVESKYGLCKRQGFPCRLSTMKQI